MFFLFFFNDTATTEIYTLSLHDALPILTWSDADDAATVLADIDFYGFSQCPGARLVHHWMDLGSAPAGRGEAVSRSEEHTSELQSLTNLVCRLLLEKKKTMTCYDEVQI